MLGGRGKSKEKSKKTSEARFSRAPRRSRGGVARRLSAYAPRLGCHLQTMPCGRNDASMVWGAQFGLVSIARPLLLDREPRGSLKVRRGKWRDL